ncbi:MAG: ribose-5-phosphate isomerase RpiA [Rhodothermales bacterium]
MTDADKAKRATGYTVAEWIEDGMAVGIGTGSTAAYAIEALGKRVRAEGLSIVGIATSFASERMARRASIPLATFDTVERLDFAFDGADEVDPPFNLIKGRGAAHTRERIVAAQAARFVVLIDPSKQVDQLGTRKPVPVEFVPMAAGPVARALRDLGARPELRMGQQKDGPVVTDQGLWIMDAHFKGIADPAMLATTIKALPGVLDHGLFIGMAQDVLVGQPDGIVQHLTR